MRILIFCIICSLLSCQPKPQELLSGQWIELGEYKQATGNKKWRQNPVLLDFKEDGRLDVFVLAYQQDTNTQKILAHWTMNTNKTLDIQLANKQQESFEILELSDQKMHLRFMDKGVEMHRLLQKIPPKKEKSIASQTIEKSLEALSFNLKASSLQHPSIPEKLTTCFWRGHYILTNIPQSPANPPKYCIKNIFGHSLLVMEGLSLRRNVWHLIQITNFDSQNLKGTYYHNGEQQKLELVSNPNAPSPHLISSHNERFYGKWMVFADQLPRDTATAEQLILKSNGELKQHYLKEQKEGHWQLCPSGDLVLTDINGYINYFKIGEVHRDSLSGYRQILSKGRQDLAAKFIRTN